MTSTFERALRRLCIAAAMAAGASAAQAAPVVFFGIDNLDLSAGGAHPLADAAASAFAAAAGPLASQSFESFALGAVPANFPVGTVNVGFTSQATQYSQVATGVGAFSTFATGGTQYLESLSANGASYFTMAFGAAVHAFGFYITDASDWLGTTSPLASLQVHLSQTSGGSVLDLLGGISPAAVSNGNVAFFGVIDVGNPITGFSISNPAINPDEDSIGLDLLMLPRAAALPLAPTALLLLAALPAALAARRRPRGG